MKFFSFFALLAIITPACAQTAAPAHHVQFGVNLSGCEFAGAESGTLCPTTADVDWYSDAGFTLFRLPVKDTTPVAKIAPAIDAALARGATVVIDWHEFRWPTVAQQRTFWGKYARYHGNAKVIYDLQNEPKGFNSPTVTNDWLQWAQDTKAIIAALRTDGVTNTIAVEWPRYSATFRFDKGEPKAKACESAACALDRIGGLGDANVVYEGHRYFDKDGSGTTAKCAAYSLGSSWRAALAKRGLRGYLGESAFAKFDGNPAATGCWKLGTDTVAELRDHPEVYLGVTWWGGGRTWPASYPFVIAPKGHQNAASPLVKLLTGKE